VDVEASYILVVGASFQGIEVDRLHTLVVVNKDMDNPVEVEHIRVGVKRSGAVVIVIVDFDNTSMLVVQFDLVQSAQFMFFSVVLMNQKT
jgi:hypothetical protein